MGGDVNLPREVGGRCFQRSFAFFGKSSFDGFAVICACLLFGNMAVIFNDVDRFPLVFLPLATEFSPTDNGLNLSVTVGHVLW